VKYLANWLVIAIGVTLIWREALDAIHIIAMKTVMALLKFGGRAKNRQTAKFKSPPNKLCVQYCVLNWECPFREVLMYVLKAIYIW